MMGTAQTRMVVAEDVYVAFGGQEVLKGVSFEVEQGEVMCMIGPSGSGKTTLLRCINHLVKVDSGRLMVDGDLVGYEERNGLLYELTERQIARKCATIGMVFQSFNLFPHLTALGNVVCAPIHVLGVEKSEARTNGRELLNRVGLGHKCDAYPRELSGGQQQRVAIARALAMDPKLMLFDEPTSALDPELVGDVLDVMRDLAASGMTMLVATHEMGFAREVGDQLMFLDNGQIVESGAPRAVIDSPQHERTQAFLSKVL
jgi:polar amino acid transport system ATP-binding protein